MTFAKASLLSALVASSAVVKAAPTPSSSCKLNLHNWAQITFQGTSLSTDDSGKVVIGGNPLYFSLAECSRVDTGSRGLEEYLKGYLVNANEPSQCLTASALDQSDATFSLEECSFNKAGNVSATQSFAWFFDNSGASNAGKGWFNGEYEKVTNATNPGLYTLKAQILHPNVDGMRGELLVDYTPNITSLPDGQLQMEIKYTPVDAPARPPSLNCSAFTVGQLNFNNETSSSNQYNGPLNAKWEAQNDTSDQFIFEQCDYSPLGLKATDDLVYGRIRPGTDLGNGAFQCYQLNGLYGSVNSNGTSEATAAWINGIDIHGCSYSAENNLDIIKYNKTDNTIGFLPFANGTQPGVVGFWTQLDYDREFGVTQYVWDPLGVGVAYVAHDNKNLTKYPPGKVTFQAAPGA